MRSKPPLLVAGGWLAIAALTVAVARHDQSAGEWTWHRARPLIHVLTAAGAVIAGHLAPLTVLVAGAMLATLLWMAHDPPTDANPDVRPILLGLAATVCGQAALVLQHVEAGVLLWVAGATAIAAGLTMVRRGMSPGWAEADPRHPPMETPELVLLLFLVAVAALFRFYRLDQIVNYFEGELAPYYAGATSLHGMWLADAGINGPWAPLHLSIYLPVWLTTHIFGSTVLAIRAAAALVSLASVPLLYAVARRAGGPPAALFATSFFVLDPLQIGWGRSDVHPHASTLWAPLLVCLALFRAIERRRTLDFALLALAMGASWQTYPSGQGAVLIPVLVFGAAYLARSPRIRWLGFKPVLSTVAGLALWTLSIPLPWLIAQHRWYFPDLLHQLGNRTSWDSAPVHGAWQLARHVLHLAGVNAWELFSGLFYHVPILFHQTFLPAAPGFLQRSLNWTALPLAVFGIMAALTLPALWRARVIVAWAVVGAAPSILSDQGFVKRAATLYPALLVLAGVGFSILWRCCMRDRRPLRRTATVVAAVSLAGLALLQSFLWFSGRYYPPGTPAIETSLAALKPELDPGTIVVLDAAHPFLPGMATYLLLDTLADPARFPVAWIPCADGPTSFAHLLENPAAGLASLPVKPWYSWTKLRPLIVPLQSVRHWNRAIFLFQDDVHNEDQPRIDADFEEALRRHPGARVSRLPGPRPDYRLRVLSFPLDSGTGKGSTTPPRASRSGP